MTGLLGLAVQNLLSPAVLFFILGIGAALARSNLSIPESIAKGMSLYLMLTIGFKGGVSVASAGLDFRLISTMLTGFLLSLGIPFIAYTLLRLTTKLPAVDAAAVAGHYGSISVVTFAAATQAVNQLNMPFEGWIVAVAASMEIPAILSALWLAHRGGAVSNDDANAGQGKLMHEILLNGSIVMLVGSFAIGWITGKDGLAVLNPIIGSPYKGVLCVFLLDMGLVAGAGLRAAARHLSLQTLAFALYMPLVSAAIAAPLAALLGLSAGGAALLITLAASSSYIAVPAAMRVALPDAKPSIYLTMSLGVTFPFNLMLGLPIYLTIAQWIAR